MKKILALVAVVALVVFAAPAFANVNPFMDVPMNHWAYDAIGQLAARGVLSGYPDGTYKGNQPMTRYEAASAVARALAVVDMTKASKQDVEMLKRLVVEFKDELDALGVKVDQIDSRLAVIEERLGGWKIRGEFRFDGRWGSNDNGLYGLDGGTDEFQMSRYRLHLTKYIDDKVTFYARLNGENATFAQYWLDVKFPWDITMRVGKQNFDWEDEDSLYVDNDAWMTDIDFKGFHFRKPFGMGEFALVVGHDEGAGVLETIDADTGLPSLRDSSFGEGYTLGARAKFNFNEQVWFSANYLRRDFKDPSELALDGYNSLSTLWAVGNVNFTPAIALRLAYYMQKFDTEAGTAADVRHAGIDSPNALKAIVDIKQEALKFTSLWLEYSKFDDGFITMNMAGPWDHMGLVTGPWIGGLYENTMLSRADQSWTDQWATFQRYFVGNARNAGFDDTTNWTFGVRYNYTPSLYFQVEYDKIENALTVPGLDDHLIRFRTYVSF
ncbi:MAG: S-layer homology domain-containing protein [Synergistota bacterium]|nr:S-layer homology domain-containing protein [Synergistota bacterium]